MPTPEEIARLIERIGGKVETIAGPLPDGSGFAVASFPLPKDHWIYAEPELREDAGPNIRYDAPPMPFRMAADGRASIYLGSPNELARYHKLDREDFAKLIRAAGRYAVRAATMNGKEMDFDPDALLNNLVIALLGYWAEDGFTDDAWANPRK